MRRLWDDAMMGERCVAKSTALMQNNSHRIITSSHHHIIGTITLSAPSHYRHHHIIGTITLSAPSHYRHHHIIGTITLSAPSMARTILYLAILCSAASAADGNRLAYLDESDLYYVG